MELSLESALAVISEISKVLTDPAPSRLDVTLAKVVDLLGSFVQMRHGIIFLPDSDSILDSAEGAGRNEGCDERYLRGLAQRVVDEIVTTGKPLVAENIAVHPAFSATNIGVLGASDGRRVSFIGVPIRVDANVVGTLAIDRILDDRSTFPLDFDVQLLTIVANIVGQTVKLHRLVACDRERAVPDKDQLQQQFSEPPARVRKKVHVKGIVGDSPALNTLLEELPVVAKCSLPVLLRGESGTGKERIAEAIHDLSPRANRPFIRLNCAALPETVLESELFGHEKGAFTSAINSRKGRFEVADKGTLFLDEIGEISASFQAKLLRVLQEGEFERVGSNQTIKVNVRVIAATNKNLEEAVERKEFRSDLYYRLSVIPLLVPPLRERRGDIPLLAADFLRKFNNENGRTLVFEADALECLMNCEFPGNIRELQSCVNRTAVLAQGSSITRNDFACFHGQCLSARLWRSGSDNMVLQPGPTVPGPVKTSTPPGQAATSPAVAAPPVVGYQTPLAPAGATPFTGAKVTDPERVIAAMESCGWVQAKAARLLGLTPRQIGYMLRKYGIEIKRL
ncbi:nif-specific transcriptional activator NifA [Mesorhizobium sp. WSM2239]|uniref:Nif-specific regulatory protein n=2 Tax=unclassified Mesorhizobium TaxID=325217 RepID=A0AAU8DHP1_9HYPH